MFSIREFYLFNQGKNKQANLKRKHIGTTVQLSLFPQGKNKRVGLVGVSIPSAMPANWKSKPESRAKKGDQDMDERFEIERNRNDEKHFKSIMDPHCLAGQELVEKDWHGHK